MKKFKIFPLILIICLVMAMAAPSAFALEDPDINAKAAVLVDLDSGKLLYGHNLHTVAPGYLNVAPMGFCVTVEE